jgi:hypothetical protein
VPTKIGYSIAREYEAAADQIAQRFKRNAEQQRHHTHERGRSM